jgi:hypothetical protein
MRRLRLVFGDDARLTASPGSVRGFVAAPDVSNSANFWGCVWPSMAAARRRNRGGLLSLGWRRGELNCLDLLAWMPNGMDGR